MAIRDIVIWPDPRLKAKTETVEVFDAELQRLLDDMVDTMYAADGVGLAAPQIGVSKRIFVVDPSPQEPGKHLQFFINPEVVEAEGETLFEEGCLSIPGEVVEVKRHTRIRMRAQDRHGEPFEVDTDDFLAIALQHELDHIEGILLVDRLSSLKREMVKKRMQQIKAEREAERAEVR
jgi:peptide deformylase